MASSLPSVPSCSSDRTYPAITDKPHQPTNIAFPKVTFGKSKPVQRSFQKAWFQKWNWLHWDTESEQAFCHTCVRAAKQGTLTSGLIDLAFISRGFQNWKDATIAFANHEKSGCHKLAVEAIITLPATTRDVSEMLSSAKAKERELNRECLLKVFRCIQFLAKQGLPLRGDGFGEEDGNFTQVCRLLGYNDASFTKWLSKSTDKYTGHGMQNEILQKMSLHILREIASSIQSCFFTIMVDETTDISTTEQVVMVLRWVDPTLAVHEDFIGLYATDSIEANSLVAIIKDVLLRLNLTLDSCRGQCYDGASNMQGVRNGVATQILRDQPKAIYTHCYGHALNLACQDMVRAIKVIRDALDTTFEISKLLKYSAKRKATYQKLKDEISPNECGFRTLCPTRWTVRAESLGSVLKNYTVLQNSLDEFSSMSSYNPEISAKVSGVAYQMSKFAFLFGVMLGEKVLMYADNLSRTLQQKDLSAAEGQVAAKLTLQRLANLRKDQEFEKFWVTMLDKASVENVDQPVLPRKRRVPPSREVGVSDGENPATPKDHYRRIYFEALDVIMATITERFDQPGYLVYKDLQTLLLDAANDKQFSEEAFQTVRTLYAEDFDADVLKMQLSILQAEFTKSKHSKPRTLQDIKEFISNLEGTRSLLSEVVKLITLVLVMPATNASSERSFSALRRVKTYLRSTMTQSRLNHLMILHVHKEHTDKLDLIKVACDFVQNNEHRYNLFGKFS